MPAPSHPFVIAASTSPPSLPERVASPLTAALATVSCFSWEATKSGSRDASSRMEGAASSRRSACRRMMLGGGANDGDAPRSCSVSCKLDDARRNALQIVGFTPESRKTLWRLIWRRRRKRTSEEVEWDREKSLLDVCRGVLKKESFCLFLLVTSGASRPAKMAA